MGYGGFFVGLNRLMQNGLFWFFVFSLISCITVQMNYLNKALDIFETTTVTPIYYVIFTTFVLLASNILFKEWGQMSFEDILGNLCGFATVIVAIFLLNAFKDIPISLLTVQKNLRVRRFQNGHSVGGGTPFNADPENYEFHSLCAESASSQS